MRNRLLGFALTALGISLYACSSNPPDPFATVQEFCGAYAKAICQVGSTCQFDPMACQTYQAGQCTANAATSETATRQYNSSKVPACIAALNNAYGNGQTAVSAATLTTINATCSDVFVGSATEGQPCSSNYDCADSTQICAAAPGQPSTCAKATPKDLNAACADPGDQCPANAYCQPGVGTSKCVMAATQGMSCSATTPCDANDRCVGGVCEPLATLGNPCSTTADCSSGLFCDTFTSPSVPATACENSLEFGGRGSVDCLGIEGQATMGMGIADAGVGHPEAGADTGSGAGEAGDAGGGG
jgi:hypothetical protein